MFRAAAVDNLHNIPDSTDSNFISPYAVRFRRWLCCCTGNVNCYLRENQERSDEIYIVSGSRSSINPVYIDESVFDPTIEDVAEPENENRRGRQKLNIRGGYCWGKPFSAESDEKALKACFGLEKAEATEVGKGTSAHVYKFKDNSDLNVAVKIMKSEILYAISGEHESTNASAIDRNKGDWVALQLSSHPKISTVYALVMQDIRTPEKYAVFDSADCVVDECQNMQLKMVVSEYVEGATLIDVASRNGLIQQHDHPMSLTKGILISILELLDFLKSNAILHRDINCNNIMITNEGVVKLIDFGSSIKLEGRSRAHSLCGTPLVIAPEVFYGDYGYLYPSECWSLGILLLDFMSIYSDRSLYDMVVSAYNRRYPDKPVGLCSSVFSYPGLNESDFICTLLAELKYEDISQLFDDVFRDYQHDPLTPVLKIIITQALCIEPDARPTIEFAKKLLEK